MSFVKFSRGMRVAFGSFRWIAVPDESALVQQALVGFVEPQAIHAACKSRDPDPWSCSKSYHQLFNPPFLWAFQAPKKVVILCFVRIERSLMVFVSLSVTPGLLQSSACRDAWSRVPRASVGLSNATKIRWLRVQQPVRHARMLCCALGGFNVSCQGVTRTTSCTPWQIPCVNLKDPSRPKTFEIHEDSQTDTCCSMFRVEICTWMRYDDMTFQHDHDQTWVLAWSILKQFFKEPSKIIWIS